MRAVSHIISCENIWSYSVARGWPKVESRPNPHILSPIAVYCVKKKADSPLRTVRGKRRIVKESLWENRGRKQLTCADEIERNKRLITASQTQSKYKQKNSNMTSKETFDLDDGIRTRSRMEHVEVNVTEKQGQVNSVTFLNAKKKKNALTSQGDFSFQDLSEVLIQHMSLCLSVASLCPSSHMLYSWRCFTFSSESIFLSL